MTQLRFIPTRVGTTWQAKEKAAGTAVHPHARGDNESGVANGTRIYGSSPRAWGQRAIIESKDIICRFIPTRVGTTSMVVINFSFLTVHPHARGDNYFRDTRFPCIVGSSPRAWGQLKIINILSDPYRFIPTRVGTTAAFMAEDLDAAGSSPRAWGQQKKYQKKLLKHRFIPTRVGTTSYNPALSPLITVHPHARGDNWANGLLGEEYDGSSPRAWGQLPCFAGHCASFRFIPTRVGTTPTHSIVQIHNAVHPHARGDNFWSREPGKRLVGSSPRAWGQR